MGVSTKVSRMKGGHPIVTPRYLFTGSRDWRDRYIIDLLICGLFQWAREHREPVTIMEGDAPGADSITGICASRMNMKVARYPADWEKNGKRAGPIRNTEMIESQPKVVFAFAHDLNESKGTRDTVRKAMKKGIPVYHIRLLQKGDL
jgi:hypothetical protein